MKSNRRKTYLFILCCLPACLPAAWGQTSATRDSSPQKLLSLTEAGVLAGNSDNQRPAPFIFHSSLNYALTPRLSAGLGTGVEFMKETLLPLTANLRLSFTHASKLQPFVRLMGGYLIPLESKMNAPYPRYLYYADAFGTQSSYPEGDLMAKGGWMINPSAGIVLQTKWNTGVVLSGGYRHQRLLYSAKQDYRLQVEQNRLSLTLGLIF
ncbi:MAG: hypothetical protein LBD89_09255 [Tannerellaceae bacterium]|jgi:hypothetical protein|nr:hypothetical protein [Tannerellaceae bacterium]